MMGAPRRELSRRERQIMDSLYRRGNATVAEVLEDLPDPPSDSAVRAALRLLEEKGQVQHTQEGPRNVYRPVAPREKVSRSALLHLIRTFFRGSREEAMAAILDLPDQELSDEELARMASLIEAVRKERDS